MAALPGVEHLQIVDDDLRDVTILTALVLPLASLQAALDVDFRALAHVLLRDLGKAAENDQAVPLRALLLLAALLVGPGVTGGEVDVADWRAGLGEADLGILTDVADQDDLVDASGHGASYAAEGKSAPAWLRHPTTGARCRR